jgi:hypothetical protein
MINTDNDLISEHNSPYLSTTDTCIRVSVSSGYGYGDTAFYRKTDMWIYLNIYFLKIKLI